MADIEALCGGSTPLQAIRIIAEPATGGDPGSVYCLAWTGSGSGGERDAALLMNAPGYQCGAYLVAGEGASVFQDGPPDCPQAYPGTRMTYPAVLDHPDDGGVRPAEYVCVLTNVGA
ncbi:hypothetical protein [Streptomyces sp. NPDC049555]|uniref:hypothetical protein n=1 Tax=unclassified Streptomyces TaxID=2593676 RepID=UPI00342BB570